MITSPFYYHDMAGPADTEDPPTRRYRSPLRESRARETRDRVVAAATEQFLTNGWAGTGMREVARTAGVSVETVYSHFPSKRALLDAVIDISVVGDEQPVPLADRPEFAALGSGRRSERIAAAARLLAAVHVRTAGFAKVVREAAPGDGQIAEVLRATRGRQRNDIDAAATLIVGRSLTPTEVDELWVTCSPEVYLLFAEDAGWTDEQYEHWAATTLARLLPRS